jgi:hypothetical protein
MPVKAADAGKDAPAPYPIFFVYVASKEVGTVNNIKSSLFL